MAFPVLVSACLVGFHCRFDGQDKTSASVLRALKGYAWIPVCPEVKAGMKTPRLPIAFFNGSGPEVLAGSARVIREDGVDVTQQLVDASRALMGLVKKWDVKAAVLKDKSPSCGVRMVYFGEIPGRGSGVFATLLKAFGVEIMHEGEAKRLRDIDDI
jgi:uncharacterized protein YbbK (DUF523 family)